jgi:hypothetical protein
MIKKFLGTSLVTFALLSGVASAQTTTASTTVGTPNTGAGGETSQNVMLLATSGAAALAGALYLARRAKLQ